MPYVYLLGWKLHKVYYYGVRYSKYATPEDLWVTYKSSSNYVDRFVEANGDPDIIQVRRVWNTGNYERDKASAMKWESTVLKRMYAIHRSDFLNRWDNNMVPINLIGPFPFEFEKYQKKADLTLLKKYGAKGSGSEIIKKKVFDTNTVKYGVHHTLGLDNVKHARQSSSLEKFGVINPFFNNKKLQEVMLERHGVTNAMHLDNVRQKHKESMANIDWAERNRKTAITHAKNKKSCPLGCKNNHQFDKGNFTNHMVKMHGWSKDQIRMYRDEN